MPVEWSEAPQTVIDIARRIIAKHHPKLADARIAFIMRSEAPVTNGKVTMGKAKKVSAELQVHIDYDFIIWLARDEWLTLGPLQREALVDHELSHCFWDGLSASIKSHDVEEFSHIIERYGLWRPSLVEFGAAVQQALPLPAAVAQRQGRIGTIDFDKIARDAGEQMRADGIDVDVTFAPAPSRSQ